MPSPREIAKQANEAAKFGDDAPGYDTVDGVPSSAAARGVAPDYRANPTNPPAGPAPAKNLK